MDIKRLYVFPNGNDANDGGINSPLATAQGAVKAVRSIIEKGLCSPVEVCFMAGEYGSMELSGVDSGTTAFPITYKAYGDGEVIFTNGITIDAREFKPVSGDAADRLSENAKKHVLEYNLKLMGMFVNHSGNICLKSNDGEIAECSLDEKGNAFELFWGNERFFSARYPNEGFREIQNVLESDAAKVCEFKSTYKSGGVVTIDDETAEHISSWRNPETAWMSGYFYHDWASASSPVAAIDLQGNEVYMANVGGYGVRKGGTYFFYNALEELDAPGEYYLDKETLKLYIYPHNEDMSTRVTLSYSRKPIIKAEDVCNVNFEGITLSGTFSSAMVINGNNCSVKNCTIKNVYYWGIQINGDNNLICGCEISHTGKGGVSLQCGRRDTLTHGNTIVENCHIHHWANIFLTYNAGIEAYGCGSIIRHNELHHNPHYVIYYNGNEHLMEYNYIHDAVQLSHDMGAIYGGRDWAAYGSIIRYNLMENIGNEKFFPCGIYWDDCHSGQTAFGNIIMNATGKSFLIGGGRDNVVENNMMILGEYQMLFDDRARKGVLEDGWYDGADLEIGNGKGQNWEIYNRTPVHNDIWKEKYPHVDMAHAEYEKTEDPNCIYNPARAVVRNNICVMEKDYGFYVAESVDKFGIVENNLLFNSMEECFADAEKYELKAEVMEKLPEFVRIPVEKIGRY